MNKNKHLLLSERIIIELSLNSEDFITYMKVHPYTYCTNGFCGRQKRW
ncbi:hypothetical protein Ana3638_04950 [Anaerocolumna sedimenticola]|uniref:Transposase n=1 Tax=Anaerocolumna sedimenticola TaxID=2696063 RepID=A0A6P1TJH9_9FIRM|nr:hypothetical protein [Anaerocolumna sedimenticola]QHQ60201.1 hypothetical protein Ana3638_04950 [Anaerocolumna sedimenticola]